MAKNTKDDILENSPFRQSFLSILTDFVEKECGGNEAEASRALGVQSRGLLGQWLRGEKLPRLDSIVAIMDKLGFNIAATGTAVPVYAVFDLKCQNFLYSMIVHAQGHRGVYGVEWRGSSMAPTIRNGDVVGITPLEQGQPLVWGELHAVIVKDELLIRTVMADGQNLSLIAMDERFSQKLPREECQIVGKVCWVLNRY